MQGTSSGWDEEALIGRGPESGQMRGSGRRLALFPVWAGGLCIRIVTASIY